MSFHQGKSKHISVPEYLCFFLPGFFFFLYFLFFLLKLSRLCHRCPGLAGNEGSTGTPTPGIPTLVPGTSTTVLGTSVTPRGPRLRLSSPSPPRLPRLPALLLLSRCLSEEPHFLQFPYFLPLQRLPPVPRDSEAFQRRGKEQLSSSSDKTFPRTLLPTRLGQGSIPPCCRGLHSTKTPGGTSSRLPPSPSPPQTPAALLGSQRATVATFTLMMDLPETAPFFAARAKLNSFAPCRSKPLFSSEIFLAWSLNTAIKHSTVNLLPHQKMTISHDFGSYSLNWFPTQDPTLPLS